MAGEEFDKAPPRAQNAASFHTNNTADESPVET